MELNIEKLVYGGDGLARLPPDEHGRGKAAFVPFVLEGERVEATVFEKKPGFVRARLDRRLESSPHRIEAGCRYFTRCGGCHYQHSTYQHQLEIKASILKENLRRITKLELGSELQIHPSPAWNYRNRTRMRVKTQPEFSLGYNRFGSHELEPIEECPISSPLINRAIAAVWDFGRGGRMPGSVREIEFFGNAQDSQMMLAVMVQSASRSESTQAGSWKAQPFADELLRVVTAAAGVVVFEEREPREEPRVLAVAGSQFLEYLTATASYRVSAGAFFQVNRFLTDELVRIVTEGYTGRMALDLYAGVGLFSTLLARQFERVVAVESSPQSFADLAYNSPGNVKPIRASVEQHLGKAGGKGRADLVVVDPPRAGLGIKVAKSIAELQAPNLAYVSCDPATLARDLIPLLGAGYRVEQAHMVDLFPQTFHLESVVKLGRSSS